MSTDHLHLPSDQLDLLEDRAPWDEAEETALDTAEPAPEWRTLELEVQGPTGEPVTRAYRWRVRWSEVDRTRWSPEDRVYRQGDPYVEEDGPYRPPGPAFDVEGWWDGAWRTVRYFDRRVEVWGMVREEAMEERESRAEGCHG